MRRTGQSPFQGRYEVPVHDYSPISEGGDAWGQAFQQVGQSIGEGIKKYKLDQEKRGVLAASLAGRLKAMEEYDPVALVELGYDEDFNVMDLGDMSLAKLEGVLGKVTQYSAEADRQIMTKARLADLDASKRAADAQEHPLEAQQRRALENELLNSRISSMDAATAEAEKVVVDPFKDPTPTGQGTPPPESERRLSEAMAVVNSDLPEAEKDATMAEIFAAPPQEPTQGDAGEGGMRPTIPITNAVSGEITYPPAAPAPINPVMVSNPKEAKTRIGAQNTLDRFYSHVAAGHAPTEKEQKRVDILENIVNPPKSKSEVMAEAKAIRDADGGSFTIQELADGTYIAAHTFPELKGTFEKVTYRGEDNQLHTIPKHFINKSGDLFRREGENIIPVSNNEQNASYRLTLVAALDEAFLLPPIGGTIEGDGADITFDVFKALSQSSLTREENGFIVGEIEDPRDEAEAGDIIEVKIKKGTSEYQRMMKGLVDYQRNQNALLGLPQAQNPGIPLGDDGSNIQELGKAVVDPEPAPEANINNPVRQLEREGKQTSKSVEDLQREVGAVFEGLQGTPAAQNEGPPTPTPIPPVELGRARELIKTGH